jgi:hypothetical protein
VVFPAGLATVQVTGENILAFDGTPLSGVIIFTSSGAVPDPAVSTLLEGSAVAPVSGGVMTPVALVATDAVSPGFTYTITQRLQTPDGSAVPAQLASLVAIPASLGPSVDISALVPAAPPPDPSAFGSANLWSATQTFGGNPPLEIPAGAVAGYVLTSDGAGGATWQAIPQTGGGLPLDGGTMTGWLAPAVVQLADAAIIVVDAALGNDFRVTLGGSRVMGNPLHPVDGQTIEFAVTQDGTGGRSVTWGADYLFGADGLPVLTAAPDKTDIVGFKYDAAKGGWLCVGWKTAF